MHNNGNVPPAGVAGDEPESNPSTNPWFRDIVEQRYNRRQLVAGGVAIAVGTMLADSASAQDAEAFRWGVDPQLPLSPGFEPVPHSTADQVVVPAGYSVQVLIPEGEPLVKRAAPYIPGDFNTGADREGQIGAHHDGIAYLPFYHGSAGNRHGLLCVNHENINPELIHPQTLPPGGTRQAGNVRPVEDEVRKEVASHGVSVVEVKREGARSGGEWKVVRNSRYNRRVTGGSEVEFTGPV